VCSQACSDSSSGLTNSSIQVSSSTGGYVATHIYGWTEFDIDRDSKALTVTTYGIDSYTFADPQADSTDVVSREPEVWQRLRVEPVIGFSSAGNCGVGQGGS